MRKALTMFLLTTLLAACHTPKDADVIIYNARIYTVDSSFSIQQSMAFKGGKILETGSDQAILSQYKADKILDLNGAAVYPGFIDAHSHFIGFGEGLVSRADLVGTASFDEVLARQQAFEKSYPADWVIGRGWDQNDWAEKEFPTKEKLDEIWPDKPVYLTRIDGHAALVNSKTLELAGITAKTKVDGGEIVLKDGQPSGVLVDNAMELASKLIPDLQQDLKKKAIMEAEQKCFAKGLTTVCDAGLEYDEVQLLDQMQKSGELKMRVYAMLTPTQENLQKMIPQGPYKTDRLNVRSIKLYADGALGSRGACLIHDYSDKPHWRGMMLSSQAYYDSLCTIAYKYGYQVNTHAIGDSGSRVILHTYAHYLKPNNDRRWRIEHAQVVDPSDFKLFGEYHIIPSVQPTHATSDMYWADERLGAKRLKSAYAYHQLLEENGWLPLGTDFPIEKIDPLLTFYAAVVRKDVKHYPEDGFQIENALSREEALIGITIWAAKGGFEEWEKGSLEPGKFADFIVLSQDIMQVDGAKIPETKIRMTFVNGELVFVKDQ